MVQQQLQMHEMALGLAFVAYLGLYTYGEQLF
jgi:hypothetical protein